MAHAPKTRGTLSIPNPHTYIKEDLSNSELKMDETIKVYNSPQPKFNGHVIVDDIKNAINDLNERITNYRGNSNKDKEYIYIDEMLIKNMMKLDDIDIAGDDKLRERRRILLKEAHTLIRNLEETCERNKRNEMIPPSSPPKIDQPPIRKQSNDLTDQDNMPREIRNSALETASPSDKATPIKDMPVIIPLMPVLAKLKPKLELHTKTLNEGNGTTLFTNKGISETNPQYSKQVGPQNTDDKTETMSTNPELQNKKVLKDVSKQENPPIVNQPKAASVQFRGGDRLPTDNKVKNTSTPSTSTADRISDPYTTTNNTPSNQQRGNGKEEKKCSNFFSCFSK